MIGKRIKNGLEIRCLPAQSLVTLLSPIESRVLDDFPILVAMFPGVSKALEWELVGMIA